MTDPADRGPMRSVIFFREDMFYFLDLPDTDDIAEHAHCNPGTVRVEAVDGTILWDRGQVQ